MQKQKILWVTHSSSLLFLSKRRVNLYLKAKECNVCSLPGPILEERLIPIACIYLNENIGRKNMSPTLQIRKHEKSEPDAHNVKVISESYRKERRKI